MTGARHAAKRSAWPDWRWLNWLDHAGTRASKLCLALILAVMAVLIAATVLAVFQREVLFQPTLAARIEAMQLTGRDIDLGKGGSCPEARFTMAVEDGAPSYEFDCTETYAVGDEVSLRRHRDDATQVYVDPIPGRWLPAAGAMVVVGTGVAAGALVGVSAVGMAIADRWRAWRRQRRRQRR